MFGSQFVLSAAQINTLAADLAPLGQQPGVRLALLLDLSGQEIVYIDSYGGLLIPSIAALAAGDMMATQEVGRLLGGSRNCNLIIQEHEELMILIARLGDGLLLMLATERSVPLGWARLALKRTSTRILEVVGNATLSMAAPAPAMAMDAEFETDFAAQLNSIW